MVLRKIEAMGVQFVTKARVSGILTKPGADGKEKFCGFKMEDGSEYLSDMVISAVGIRGRDDLAKKCGIKCASRGGISVDDDLKTSADGVYAIGECASWRGNTYGLIAPGIEMADSAPPLPPLCVVWTWLIGSERSPFFQHDPDPDRHWNALAPQDERPRSQYQAQADGR